METRRLIALVACALTPAFAAAEQGLKLPQSSDQYKELLKDSTDHGDARVGTVVRIFSESETRKGTQPALTNPPVETVQGEPQLQPVTVAGKGAKQQRKDSHDAKVLKRQIKVRWPDNSIGVVDLPEGQSFKVGDRVVLHDGVLVHAH